MDENQHESTTPTPPPPPDGGPAGPAHGAGAAGRQASPTQGDRLLQEVRALRRSSGDRVVAGVCGGVAHRLGIDPLLVRVLTGVLALFGAGVVLYALGWLLLPVDDGRPSLGAQAVGHRGATSSTGTVLLAVGLAIVAAVGLGAVGDHWGGSFLLVLAVAGLVAWLLLRERRGESTAAGDGHGQPAAATYTRPTAMPSASASAAGGVADPVTLTKGAPTGTHPTHPTEPVTSPLPAHQPPGPSAGSRPPVPPPPPPVPRGPRSVLFSVTMSLVLVGLGTLTLIDLSGPRVAPGAYPALALTIIALGLLVGTWSGRSRGLIVMGIVAALVTGAVSAADDWADRDGRRVDVRVTPATLAELPASQDVGAGSVRYDLTRLDFTGVSRSVHLSVSAGEIVVVVPADVDVTATASLGIGQVDLFGDSRGGFPSDITVTDVGADGVGGGTLDLTLDAGVGHLEVRRG